MSGIDEQSVICSICGKGDYIINDCVGLYNELVQTINGFILRNHDTENLLEDSKYRRVAVEHVVNRDMVWTCRRCGIGFGATKDTWQDLKRAFLSFIHTKYGDDIERYR